MAKLPRVAAMMSALTVLTLAACSNTTTTTPAPGTTAPTGSTGTTAGTAPGTTTKGTTPGTTATPGGTTPADDNALAKSALVTDSQLPPGTWKASTSSRSKQPDFASVPECTAITADVGVIQTERTGDAKALWDMTDQTGGTQLSDEVELYATVRPVQVAQVLVQSPELSSCYKAYVQKAAAADPTVQITGDVDATEYNVGLTSQALGVDWVSGLRIKVAITSQGQTVYTNLRLVIFGVGRGIGTVTSTELSTTNTPPDVSGPDFGDTVKAAVSNLKAAVA